MLQVDVGNHCKWHSVKWNQTAWTGICENLLGGWGTICFLTSILQVHALWCNLHTWNNYFTKICTQTFFCLTTLFREVQIHLLHVSKARSTNRPVLCLWQNTNCKSNFWGSVDLVDHRMKVAFLWIKKSSFSRLAEQREGR